LDEDLKIRLEQIARGVYKTLASVIEELSGETLARERDAQEHNSVNLKLQWRYLFEKLQSLQGLEDSSENSLPDAKTSRTSFLPSGLSDLVVGMAGRAVSRVNFLTFFVI
jgi:hypothetical protein